LILECQRSVKLALFTSVSSAETEANNMLQSTPSSCCSYSSTKDDMMLIDATNMLFQHTAMVVADIDGYTEDCTIRWHKHGVLWIHDASKNDTTAHFWFRKHHLQEMPNKIWPCTQEYLAGDRMAVKYDSGNYSEPYESHLLMVLF
jgi:hypothetical protein